MLWIGVAAALAVAYAGFWYYSNHRYDEFAKCLAAKQAKMYGLYWCPHCAEQKAMFGKAFQYVPYVECAIKDSHELAPACRAAGVKLFPSWQFGGNTPIEGVFPMQELSDKTGCSLP
jgi:glutaredoxin